MKKVFRVAVGLGLGIIGAAGLAKLNSREKRVERAVDKIMKDEVSDFKQRQEKVRSI